MSIFKKIKVFLYRNALSKTPNTFKARVRSERSLGVKDICISATKRGGADMSASAMEHAVNLWLGEMAYLLCDGFAVNAEWFTAAVKIKGVFHNPREDFDPMKHSVEFDFRQGALLRKEREKISVKVLGMAKTAPEIVQVTDIKTGSVNDLLTPGRNLRIKGEKLKITGGNKANGVYFINKSNGERIKINDSDVIINKPSELVIVIPELEAGTYKLKLTTQFSGHSKILLKKPVNSIFNRALTVA